MGRLEWDSLVAEAGLASWLLPMACLATDPYVGSLRLKAEHIAWPESHAVALTAAGSTVFPAYQRGSVTGATQPLSRLVVQLSS